MLAHTLSHTYAHTCAHTHARTHTHKHTYAHTHMHRHTHTHTYTHTLHTRIQATMDVEDRDQHYQPLSEKSVRLKHGEVIPDANR